jgi:outer membrane autotransporter protein
MNRTFKVVFSKVRGTMVVASEAAATPHKKAAKTVIAAAAALAMGTVMAQGWAEPDGIDQTSERYTSVEDLTQNQYNYVQTSGTTGFVSVSTEGDHVIEGKEIWVTATGEKTQSHALHANGTGVKLTNTGKIYIQAGEDAKSWSQKGMMAGGGATVVNEGDIVAKNAYGMTVEKDVASHIENGVNGTITVLDQGAGIELGGESGSTAVNNGKITVSDIAEGSWGHGVLIKADDGASTFTFTNNGEISATGTGASAIEVQAGTGTKAEINLIEGSQIDGIVKIGANTDVTLNAQGTNDSFDLQVEETANFNLNVKDDANLTLENGNGASIDSVTIENGRLNASIWQDDNKFKQVRVSEGGIFNIEKLNSGGSQSQDPSAEGYVPHDTLLLAYGADYTLDGGKLYVAGSEFNGNIKVGVYGDEKSHTTGALKIADGDYSFATMTVGSTGTLTTQDGASLTLGSLHVYKVGYDGSAAGILVEGNSELNAEKITFEDGTGKLTVIGGTLNTTADSLLGEDGLKDNFELTSGTVGISDALDLDKWNGSGFEKVTVVADEVAAQNADGQLVEITEINNADLSTNVDNVNAVGGIVYGSAVLNVQLDKQNAANINPALKGVQTVALTQNADADDAQQTLHLQDNFRILGNGTEVISGSNEGATVNVDTYTLTLGSTSSVSTSGGSFAGTISGTKGTLAVEGGVFNIGTVNVGTVNVGEVADLRVDNLTVTTATVEGSLFAQNIHAGTVTVNNMAGFQTLAEGATLKSGDDEAADVYIAKAAVDEQGEVVPQIQGTLNLKGDSYLTTNGSAGSLERAVNVAQKALGDKFNLETDAVAYVDQSIVIGKNGGFYFGNVKGDNGGGVKLATNSVTVIDADHFMQSGESVFAGAGANLTLGGGGTTNARIVLDNLLSKGTLDLTAGDIVNVNDPSGYITSTNLFLELKGTVEGDPSSVVIGFNEGAVKDAAVAGAVDQILTAGGNRKNQIVINAIGQQDEFLNAAGDQLNGRGEQAVKEFVAAPVTAGTYNMAYDSMELISNALIQRNLDAKKGLGVWADVFYGSNESDSLYGDSGYSSDIYGGMLGVDFGFGEGARVGAALSIGSGDGDSEGSVSKYSTDSDFWGLSVYAGKDFGGLTFTGDMSYLWLDNDIGGSVAGVSASESLDSTVFSLGVRADWKAYEGKVLQVVPHAGVRWASIDVDDYRGLSMDKMNVIEMPIGVTVKGVFETASGWQVAPEIDFTAAPQIGDTEVETIIGDVDVIDNVYNASIGVNAGTDAVRFGLSYKYGFGNDGRSNNTFNLKASYLF